MGDIRSLNQGAVNRRAAQMLESMGREPNPDRMHCLDLVLWSLEEDRGDVGEAVIETLRAMATWLPQRLLNFLELLPGQEYEPPGWESAETPMELAAVVLNDMEAKMFVKFPWYGSLEP